MSKIWFFIGCFLCWAKLLFAQVPSTNFDSRLAETKWRYAYMLHVESNTVIHKADKNYLYFLYFRYNHTYQQYLNGSPSNGSWEVNGNELSYAFRHISKFYVTHADNQTLTLQFNQPNSKGTFQYHFVNADDDAPFVRPDNELPLVKIKSNRLRTWWNRNVKRELPPAPEQKEIYISVELVGGGFYGGIDPVLRDYIRIKSNGRLVKEFMSQYNGLLITKKTIPRAELEQFAEYVIAQRFFDFERFYDCQTELCQQRKRYKPTPTPLRLSISYGNLKKVVTVSIWGKDDKNIQYVDYPPALNNIIDAIQRMGNRIE